MLKKWWWAGEQLQLTRKKIKQDIFLFVRESTVSAFFLLAAQKKNSDDTTRAFPPLTLNYEWLIFAPEQQKKRERTFFLAVEKPQGKNMETLYAQRLWQIRKFFYEKGKKALSTAPLMVYYRWYLSKIILLRHHSKPRATFIDSHFFSFCGKMRHVPKKRRTNPGAGGGGGGEKQWQKTLDDGKMAAEEEEEKEKKEFIFHSYRPTGGGGDGLYCTVVGYKPYLS